VFFPRWADAGAGRRGNLPDNGLSISLFPFPGRSAIFSLAVLAIGALWILRDAERQAWHDRIAGTYVVRVPRNYPLCERTLR
jgi:uncharacterized RDD family membrane protein YckC